jgi:hypothetical protein
MQLETAGYLRTMASACTVACKAHQDRVPDVAAKSSCVRPTVRDADLTHTVHVAVTRLAERVLDHFDASPAHGLSLVPLIARDDSDPQLRHVFALGASAGWFTLGGACILAMLVVGVPAQLVFGEAAGNVVLTVCLTLILVL